MGRKKESAELKGFEQAMFGLNCQIAAKMAHTILKGDFDTPRDLDFKMEGLNKPQIKVVADYMDTLMKEHMRENMHKAPPQGALAEVTKDGIRLHVGTGHYPLAGFLNMQDAARYLGELSPHTKSLAEYDSVQTRVLSDMQWQADASVEKMTMNGAGKIDPAHVVHFNEELLTRRLNAMHQFHNPEAIPSIALETVSRGTSKTVTIKTPADSFMSMAIREPEHLFNILPPRDHDSPPGGRSTPGRG